MHIDIKVDREKVFEEFEGLKKTYSKLGVEYDELEPTKGLPDQVYTTDTGVPVGKIFIKSNYRYGQRKPEATVAAEYFTSKGYAVYQIPPAVSFEGEGDLIRMDNTYFMGWGQRTSYQAEEYLALALQHDVVPLKLRNPEFFHLDTCFAPLKPDVAIYYPNAFTDEGKLTLSNYFEELIPVTKQDADAFACNLVLVNDTIVVNEAISEELRGKIESYGFTIEGIRMHEYLKGGGSVKCVSLQIYD